MLTDVEELGGWGVEDQDSWFTDGANSVTWLINSTTCRHVYDNGLLILAKLPKVARDMVSVLSSLVYPLDYAIKCK